MASTRSISAAAYGTSARVALRAEALVALDADQPHRRLLACSRSASATASSCVRQPVRPPGRPSSSITSNGALPAWRSAPGLDQRELRRRVDEEDDAQAGVLAPQRLDRGEVAVAEHLVRDQRVAHAGGDADRELRHRARRSCPRRRPRAGAGTAAATSSSCRAARGRCPSAAPGPAASRRCDRSPRASGSRSAAADRRRARSSRGRRWRCGARGSASSGKPLKPGPISGSSRSSVVVMVRAEG